MRLFLIGLLFAAGLSAQQPPACVNSYEQWADSGSTGYQCEATCWSPTSGYYACVCDQRNCNTRPSQMGNPCRKYDRSHTTYEYGTTICPRLVSPFGVNPPMYGYAAAGLRPTACTPSCYCQLPSPIVVDTRSEGFHLTSQAGGVQFKIGGPDHPATQTAWLDPAYHNGWLVADFNGNGTIDDASELFGTYTPQNGVDSDGETNGFNALHTYDVNGDFVIDANDTYIWPLLRVWIDANHDGISQPSELYTMAQLKITGIGTLHNGQPFSDTNGNQFYWMGATNVCELGVCGGLRLGNGSHVATTIYDVLPSYDGSNW